VNPLAEQIANVLRTSSSHAHCFACLAVTIHTPEPALREAAQGLVLQEGFELGDKQCVNCQRFEKVVWFSPGQDRPRCGLCRLPIMPAAVRTTVNGTPYHLGCWDLKTRRAEEKNRRT
jgi:recombinational DNA repair protein (RecF pathway)